ncbi:hypothetical protein HK100_009944 [Physocladia obscura]|uniref:L domain-like protein n=1 Tax=Physocladia obscura TaxID=109957 RepID=A0AAD5T8Z2_9FUNG|nr:hypothetical protein HK100_009944 [Physocladia obscura]
MSETPQKKRQHRHRHRNTKDKQTSTKTISTKSSANSQKAVVGIGSLPIELCVQILEYIPLDWVFVLRRASRGMCTVLDSSLFAQSAVTRLVRLSQPIRRGEVTWPYSDDALWFHAPQNAQNAYAAAAFSQVSSLLLGRYAANLLVLECWPKPIPNSIAFLSALHTLSLSQMSLCGPLPESFSTLSNLVFLNLSENTLCGPLTPIMTLLQLKTLNLASNEFDEMIPDSIGNLKYLNQLILNKNKLIGPIPNTIGAISNLAVLDVASNSLSGPIPREISSLTHLIQFLGSYNQFSGSIPPEISGLSELRALFLSRNKLSGSIPVELTSLQLLTHINLSHNNLSGSIPPELFSILSLRELSLCSNNLSGLIPDSIGNFTRAEHLDLSFNILSGVIPKVIGNLQKNLYGLKLNCNQLSGEIPDGICLLTKLAWLHLDDNNLVGPLPKNIGNLRRLRKLFLKNNKMTLDSIPQDIARKSSMWLLLRQNGCVPVQSFTSLVSFGASYLDSGSHTPSSFVPPNTALVVDQTGVAQAGTRNSNGPTFPEVLAAGDLLQAGYLSAVGGCTGNLLGGASLNDAAYSGAACDTTIFGGTIPTEAPFDVIQQVDSALATSLINSSTLFLFMAATQDISGIVASDTPAATAQQVANCFQTQINRLAAAGAIHFLLAGIYSFDKAPQNAALTATAKTNIATQVSTLNQLLSAVPANIATTNPASQTWFLDTNALYLNKLIGARTTFYGTTGDVTDMCSTNEKATGNCANNPDSFLWWDVHHPTRQTHKYLAQAMFSLLTAPGTTGQASSTTTVVTTLSNVATSTTVASAVTSETNQIPTKTETTTVIQTTSTTIIKTEPTVPTTSLASRSHQHFICTLTFICHLIY